MSSRGSASRACASLRMLEKRGSTWSFSIRTQTAQGYPGHVGELGLGRAADPLVTAAGSLPIFMASIVGTSAPHFPLVCLYL